MTANDRNVERYLSEFSSHLSGMPASERQDAVAEISRHIADAVASGQQLERVLDSLGRPDRLASGYDKQSVLCSPSESSGRSAWATVAVAALFTLGGIPAIVATIILGTLGTGFLVTGLTLCAAGLATLSGLLPSGTGMSASPVGAIIVGPIFTATGALVLASLVGCFWLATKTVQRVLPMHT